MRTLIINLIVIIPVALGNLQVSGKEFIYNGQHVFLSGVNFAWDEYARDIGSGAYSKHKDKMEGWLAKIEHAGGNAVRFWLHIDGAHSPLWDNNGHVTGADTQSLITELSQFLDAAAKHNIFVIISLWNGAVKPTQMFHLFHNEAALQSYLNKVLTPMAKALEDHKALAAWEVMNEPEGLVKEGITDSNKCFDTNKLKGSYPNWVGTGLTMREVLSFINLHAAAIHSAAPKTLVTNGGWKYASTTDAFPNSFNYYKDQCLTAAGNKTNGHLDFYQIHTYTWHNMYDQNSVMKRNAQDFKLEKPLIIGEFSTDCSESKNATKNYKHVYEGGYAGAFAWQFNESGECSDKQNIMEEGMNAIKDMTSNGKIRIKI